MAAIKIEIGYLEVWAKMVSILQTTFQMHFLSFFDSSFTGFFIEVQDVSKIAATGGMTVML